MLFASETIIAFHTLVRLLREEYDIRGQLERCKVIINITATDSDGGLFSSFLAFDSNVSRALDRST